MQLMRDQHRCPLMPRTAAFFHVLSCPRVIQRRGQPNISGARPACLSLCVQGLTAATR